MNRHRNTSRRNTSYREPSVAKLADQLAQRLDRSPEDFRYVEIRYYDGQQWTIKSCWQVLESDGWIDLDWTSYQF